MNFNSLNKRKRVNSFGYGNSIDKSARITTVIVSRRYIDKRERVIRIVKFRAKVYGIAMAVTYEPSLLIRYSDVLNE